MGIAFMNLLKKRWSKKYLSIISILTFFVCLFVWFSCLGRQMGFGRNLFVSGVSGTDQKESNRKETHGKNSETWFLSEVYFDFLMFDASEG